jgi:hypothetical protein
MPSRRLVRIVARALMALGLSVGVLAIGLWTFDIKIEVPAWMWRVAAIKLGLAAAGGLIAAGAVLLRYVRQSSRGGPPGAEAALPDESHRALAVPPWPPSATLRERTPDRVTPALRPPTP